LCEIDGRDVIASTRQPDLRRRLAVVAIVATAAVVVSAGRDAARADDTAGLKTPDGTRPVELKICSEKDRPRRLEPLVIDGWEYRAVPAAEARDGVPWELIVTPVNDNAKLWQKGESGRRGMPPLDYREGQFVGDRARLDKSRADLPVIEVPQVLWKQWMASGYANAVGIHFHEFVSDDVARILFTLHKVPPDGPDGKPLAPEAAGVRAGTRIEATLLAPVVYSVDQSILVRVDPLEKERTAGRIRHELGHAQVSQDVLLAVLRGPQDADPKTCTGRRSQTAFYWRRQLISRSWDGCRGGKEEVAALRTSIVLVPPTRWSLLLPIPPERVTQQHIQAFNDVIVRLSGVFQQADNRAQDDYHAVHGAYE